jgi:hypothetical protein
MKVFLIPTLLLLPISEPPAGLIFIVDAIRKIVKIAVFLK